MTQVVELPALDGRDVLGFLAALGTLRLLNEHAQVVARLSFDEHTARARLHTPLGGVDEVVKKLVEIVAGVPAGGCVPGVPPTFPLTKSGPPGRRSDGDGGGDGDPMRVPRAKFPQLVAGFGGDAGPDGEVLRWLTVLLTDLAVDAKGRVALTPYSAPAGQQNLRTFFSKGFELIRADPTEVLRQALVRWRRVDKYSGEYLDHRVIRRAVDLPSGEPSVAGVPGATWLAVMALPLLRLTGDGGRAQASLWHRPPGARQSVMIWPLWRQPLDPYAVSVLLEHPALRPRFDDGRVTVDPGSWPALGIFAVGSAERRPVPESKSAGVLTPSIVHLARARR